MDLKERLEVEHYYHSNIEQILENLGNCKLLAILAGFYASKVSTDDEELTKKRLEIIVDVQKHIDDILDLLSRDRVLYNKTEAELLVKNANSNDHMMPQKKVNGMPDDDEYHFK